MPFIPPTASILRLDSQSPLAQSALSSNLNVSLPLPSIDIPEVHMPSFLALYQAIVEFFAKLPAHVGRLAKEHLGDIQAGKIVLLVLVAAIAFWFALRGLAFIFLVLRCAAGSVLRLVGFTAKGVAAGSVAAGAQSAVYGASTGGVFSVLQSLGTTLE